MKILHVGNLANFGFLSVKVLRDYGIDAELLARKPMSISENPKSQDVKLESNGYPDWINFYDTSKIGWKMKVIKQIRDNKYDLTHAYVELPIFAMLSGKKFVSHALGSDMSELAFSNSFKGMLLRRAYKKSKTIIFVPHHYPMLKKLKLSHKGIFIPFIVDHDKFKPQKIETYSSKFKNKFIIFHPTNQIWDVKANDRFLRAFIRLAKKNKNLFLILGERGKNIHEAKELLKNNGIQNQIEFIPTQSQEKLQYYYNLCDVVADHFSYGTLGGITFESMCTQKPVLAHMSEIYSKLYKEIPPIVNVKTEEEIYDSLNELINSKSLRLEIGRKSRNWIINHNNKRIFAKRCELLYGELLSDTPVDEIRNKIYDIN